MNHRRPLQRPAPADLPRKHWAGTDGARDVLTSQFEAARDAVGEAILEAGLAVLSGAAGLGKTFTAVSVAEELAIPAHYLEQRPGVRGKSIEIDLLTALGIAHDPRAYRRDLQDTLAAACATKRAVIVDQADRLGAEGVDIIRYLWTQASNATAFIFVGFRVDVLLATNPELDSRIERRVAFRTLDLEEGVAAMRAYHPVFGRARDALLVRIHALTRGNFRDIAKLLRQILLEGGSPEPRLTGELLEVAWRNRGTVR